MSVSKTIKIHHLPDFLFCEIQYQNEPSLLDMAGYFEKVPFLTDTERRVLVIHKYDSGKPYIMVGNKYLGYSISHTENCYLIGINKGGEVGVDIERVSRHIHPKLRSRITHKKETNVEHLSTLQLWTIKEAVLKLTGSGLRTNMNNVLVECVDEINFRVHHDNKEISIVSLNVDGFWISVAWTITI